jgi:hypothetical protein
MYSVIVMNKEVLEGTPFQNLGWAPAPPTINPGLDAEDHKKIRKKIEDRRVRITMPILVDAQVLWNRLQDARIPCLKDWIS